MPAELPFDIDGIDLTRTAVDIPGIEAVNPHRHELRLLDGIAYESEDHLHAIARKEVGDNEFWVRGHIPGRPIFPGVLMIEAAAQLASYQTMRVFPDLEFVGFGGVDDVKFRGQVVPGDTLYIVSNAYDIKRRRARCRAVGLVNDKVVFEAHITGMPF